MTDALAQAGERDSAAGDVTHPATPPAPVKPGARAGWLRRMGAVAYEALLLTALLFVASFALLPLVSPGVVSGAAPTALTIPSLPWRLAQFFCLFALCGAYYVWCWTGGRRTLPQKTWHLRIVGKNDEPPSGRVALIRYVAAGIGPVCVLLAYVALAPLGQVSARQALWLCGLNFLWALVDRDRQFLHDRIAGTRVLLRD